MSKGFLYTTTDLEQLNLLKNATDLEQLKLLKNWTDLEQQKLLKNSTDSKELRLLNNTTTALEQLNLLKNHTDLEQLKNFKRCKFTCYWLFSQYIVQYELNDISLCYKLNINFKYHIIEICDFTLTKRCPSILVCNFDIITQKKAIISAESMIFEYYIMHLAILKNKRFVNFCKKILFVQ